MAYTSYRQRRALGKRYGTDPALELEKERLRQEYAMVPYRERTALAKQQHADSLRLKEEQLDAQETAGMVGTAGNVLSTAGTLRALTMEKGAPFFGETVSGMFGGGKTATDMAALGNTAGVAGGGTLAGSAPSVGVVPVGGMLPGGVHATTTGVAAATEAGTAATGAATGIGSMLAPVGAGAVGGMIGEKIGDEVGDWLGIGGDKEQSMVGGALGGAGLGFAVGGPVGAVVGGVVGLVGGSTWICTEIDKHIPLNKDEQEALKKLRKYSREAHNGWLQAYLNEGQNLVKRMNEKHGKEFYAELKKTLVDKIAEQISNGDEEGAFVTYLDKTTSLMAEYEIEFKEVK